MENGRHPGPVPERWLLCPRKASFLIANKFLAFKAPLSDSFDDQVPAQYRFPPRMVFQSMKTYKVKIGLWIDLTNTSRFYPEDCVRNAYKDNEPERSVVYFKLNCRGHGETPSEEQTNMFVSVCENFCRKNPLDAIGVHCTHGFNRTGFMIVSYLVQKMDWSVDAALAEFSKARSPGIYKGDYIKELFRRYDEEESAPEPPHLPSWCLEVPDLDQDDDDDDDDEDEDCSNNSQTSSSGPKKRKNFNKGKSGAHGKRPKSDKIPEFMEGVPGVTYVSDNQKRRQIQVMVQEMCGFIKKNEFPGCQPVSMDRKNINLLKTNPYRVSWKADGTRYIMLIDGEGEVFCIDRDNAVFQVHNLRFVHRKDLDRHLKQTLLDGEMVIDKHKGQDIPRYLIYDIMVLDSTDVKHFPFHPMREQYIQIDIINPRNEAMSQGKICKTKEPFGVRLKQFYPVEKASSFFSDKFCKQLAHKPDGLIFQPSSEPYTPGRCPSVLKWKPPSHNSVDFRLRIVTESGEGLLTRKVGQLFVNGYDLPFAVMKYCSAIKDLDKKIIECRFDLSTNQWIFMKERTDKSFPNSVTTAQGVCTSIRYPVTKNDLLYFINGCRYRSDDELMPPPGR